MPLARNRSLPFIVLGFVLACACATDHRPAAATAAVPAPEPAGPEIVRLVGRDHTITVTAGHGGPRYSIATSSGQVLVSRATLDDLRVHHPELYRLVEPATVLDARAD